MKKRRNQIIVLVLCLGILCAFGTAASYALAEERLDEKENQLPEEKPESAQKETVLKDETVYVLASSDGTVNKVIVSDWLQSEAIDGKEDQTESVYSQSEIEKALPVEMKISYTLNGQAAAPEELAGKSGRVSIRFDFTNQQTRRVSVGQKEEQLYVPFVVLTGLMLDNEVFSNIEVTNGRLINDGDHTAVIGLTFPGLQQNLKADSEILEIPDYFEITADAVNFQMQMTLTLASSEPFSQLELNDIDSIEDLSNSMGQLSDAMSQLLTGSSALADGLSVLSDKSSQLTAGIDQLKNGADTLNQGASALDSGLAELKTGADQLSQGLDILSSKNDELNQGAAQIFELLLQTAQSQLTEAGLEVPALSISNYSEVLSNLIGVLDTDAVYEQAYQEVSSAVEAQRSLIAQQVSQAVEAEVYREVSSAVEAQVKTQAEAAIRENVLQQIVLSSTGLDYDSYISAVEAGSIDEKTQAEIAEALDAQMQSEDIKALIAENTSAQMETEEIQALIKSQTEQQLQSAEVQEMIAANTDLQIQKLIAETMASEEVQSKLNQAAEGARSIIALKTSLDSYNTFYLGLQSYTSGVSQAAEGARSLAAGSAQLKDGGDQLSAGAVQLYNGIETLSRNTPALLEGINQLKDGAQQLGNGLKELDEKGIQKLVDAVDGDLDTLIDRLQGTAEAAADYHSFAEEDAASGQVKFIYRTEGIEADK